MYRTSGSREVAASATEPSIVATDCHHGLILVTPWTPPGPLSRLVVDNLRVWQRVDDDLLTGVLGGLLETGC